MEYFKKSIDKRALHKREYDNRMNEKRMQTTEEKVDTSKALEASLVETESSGTDSRGHDTSSRSGNDPRVDDAYIKPVYDEEPMAERKESACAKPHHMIVLGSSRYSSNDMVHKHYLEEAKKQTQELGKNSKTRVMPSTRSKSTTDGSKPKPRINNQNSKNWHASKSSCKTTKTVPIAEHSRNSRNFSDSKHFVCSTCQKCVFNANHDACVTKFLNEVNSRAKVPFNKTTNRNKLIEQISVAKKPKRLILKGHKFSIKKTTTMHEKTMTPRSCLRWKPTGKIFNTVGLRCVPTRKIFFSSTTKVDSEPTNGLDPYITKQYECKQTLDVSAGNMSYLSDFEELNGGYVAFGGNPKGGKISGKEKIKTENQLSLKVKVIKSDNRTEFKNNNLNQLCGIKGIKREFSVPRTPQQNGIAGRKNMTLIEAARTMLADLLLSIPFWAEAVNIACYVQNRVLVTKPHTNTPYELLHGRTPNAAFDGKEHDFDAKKLEFEVILSPSSSAQSRKQDDKTKKEAKGKSPVESFTRYRDLSAEFEDCSDNSSNEVNAAGTIVPTVRQNSSNSTNPFSAAGPLNTTASPTHGKSSFIDAYQLPNDPYMPELEDITYSDDEDDVGAEADLTIWKLLLQSEEPKGVHQALKDPSWIEAMQEELLQFKMQKVWVLVDLPHGKRAIVTKWVFRNKKNERGIMPLGFEGPDHPDKVYKVVKALYGLHQAPKACQDKYVAEILRKFGLTKGKSASTPIDTEKPLLKAPDGEDVDVHTYSDSPLLSVNTPRSNEDRLELMELTVFLLPKVEKVRIGVNVNDVIRVQALVDKKKVVITEAVIREVIRLDDVEGVDCLPNEKIDITN
nr:ribonuclease H-like domain-containing protein [Tanacetum cinerariifolium]